MSDQHGQPRKQFSPLEEFDRRRSSKQNASLSRPRELSVSAAGSPKTKTTREPSRGINWILWALFAAAVVLAAIVLSLCSWRWQ
jgi:hypothetical protein